MTTNAIIIPAPKPVNPVAITLPVRTTTIANSKMQLNMIFNIVTIAPTKEIQYPQRLHQWPYSLALQKFRCV